MSHCNRFQRDRPPLPVLIGRYYQSKRGGFPVLKDTIFCQDAVQSVLNLYISGQNVAIHIGLQPLIPGIRLLLLAIGNR